MLNPSKRHDARSQGAVRDVLDWDVDLYNSPARGARFGGDWCDAFAISDDRMLVTIGDVSGHGEAVGDTTDVMRTAIFSAIRKSGAPSTALTVANTAACERGEDVIVTGIVAILDRRLRTLTFANAGHPPPLMMTAGAHAFLTPLEVGDLPLGIFPKHRCSDYVIAVPADALIVFYTDGITEHDRDILKGESELVEACRAVYHQPTSDIALSVAHRVFAGLRGHDDAAAAALHGFRR